jgi:hypothetical protein
MVIDELRLSADDAPFKREHVVFLANNYRAMFLKQRYGDARRDVPVINYQSILVPMTLQRRRESNILVSDIRIPDLLNLNGFEAIDIHPPADYTGNLMFALVTDERFRVAGSGKYKTPFAYFALGKDGHLRARSLSPDVEYLRAVQVDALFENPLDAIVDNEGKACPDVMETPYPLEADLIPLVIQAIVKELGTVLHLPGDDTNNAADDLTPAAGVQQQQQKSDR